MGILLSKPDVCCRVAIAALRDEAEEIAKKLQEAGAFQVAEPRVVKGRALELVEELVKLYERASTILTEFLRRLPRDVTVRLDHVPSIEEARQSLPRYVEELERELSEIKKIEDRVARARKELDELIKLREFLSYVAQIFGMDASLNVIEFEGSALAIHVFRGSAACCEKLEGLNVVAKHIVGDTCFASIAYLRIFENDVLEKLRSLGMEKVSLNGKRLRDAIQVVDSRIEELRKVVGEEIEVSKIVERNLQRIAFVKLVLDNEFERIKLLKLGISTRYSFVVEGWVPRSLMNIVEGVVRSTKSGIVLEISTEEEPPVRLRNPRPLKPFELIPTLYGYPSPREWDPTPIMAYSFVLFFAFMLGDAGYALGLIIAARYVLPKLVDNPESETVKAIQRILYVGAGATIVFGLLTGSLFGPQPWLPSIIATSGSATEKLGTLMQVLMQWSMLVGFAHILLAHIIAAIKNFKLGSRWSGINELAIACAMIFGAIYICGWLNIYSFDPTILSIAKYGALASVALIIVSKILAQGALGAMLWIFDLTGPLSDVISYVRLAAINMATTIMAFVFNDAARGILASMCGALGYLAGSIVGGIVVAIFLFIAHIFNLALGTLGAFVHSLRLCILEFGTKFYEGSGKPFTPIKIELTRYVQLRKG